MSQFFVRDNVLLVNFWTKWLLFCVRYNGLVNAKAVGISAGPDNKGFVLTTKRSKVNKYFLIFKNFLPSIAHISTPFFHKTVFFFSKIFFGKPSKFLEVCLNSEYMWKWSPVYNFNSARALKKIISAVSAGVEDTSTLPNSDTQKDLLMYHRYRQCCGSGIQCFLTPGSGIRNRFFPDPGSRIPDPKPILLRVKWQFFGKKVL